MEATSDGDNPSSIEPVNFCGWADCFRTAERLDLERDESIEAANNLFK